MARTVRRTTGKDGRPDYDAPNVRPYYCRELKWARKMTNRRNRNQANEALRTMHDPESIVIQEPVHTSGWISH